MSKNIIYTPLIVLVGLVISISAIANTFSYSKDLELPAGVKLKLEKIDAKNSMVLVSSVKFPGEEDSWLKIEDLLRAAKLTANARKVDRLNMFKYPERVLGKVYKLEKPVSTYFIKKTK